jgi:hypothetical protein
LAHRRRPTATSYPEEKRSISYGAVALLGGHSVNGGGGVGEVDECDNIKVALRIRPLNKTELNRGDYEVVKIDPDGEHRRLIVEHANAFGGLHGLSSSQKSSNYTNNNGTSTTPTKRSFNFHACLGPEAGQEEVMSLCAIPQLLDAAVDGYNVTLMAYGQTGSGKTYTITGRDDDDDDISDGGVMRSYLADDDDDDDDDTTSGSTMRSQSVCGDSGIVCRSAEYIFTQVEELNNKRQENTGNSTNGGTTEGGERDGYVYTVSASYCEIYNEGLYDLLQGDGRQLAVRWDAKTGAFYVPELTVVPCSTLADLLQVINLGLQRRRVGSHALNKESSRSHAILTVNIDSTPEHVSSSSAMSSASSAILARQPSNAAATVIIEQQQQQYFGVARKGKVTFVDLAGSERIKDSQSTGVTLRETSSINRSLFTLGKVISALADRSSGGGRAGPSTTSIIPYRDSKLTKLLMDSLGGSAMCLIVACCSPSNMSIEETLSTLGYAARAKNIRNRPALQVDAEEAAVNALKREARLLRAENTYLRQQLQLAYQPVRKYDKNNNNSNNNDNNSGGEVVGEKEDREDLDEEVGGGEKMVIKSDACSSPSSQPSGTATTPANTLLNNSNNNNNGRKDKDEIDSLKRKLDDSRLMMDRFSREMGRLAAENQSLRSGKYQVSENYGGALEELEWLRAKLDNLEGALRSMPMAVASSSSSLLPLSRREGEKEDEGGRVEGGVARGSGRVVTLTRERRPATPGRSLGL